MTDLINYYMKHIKMLNIKLNKQKRHSFYLYSYSIIITIILFILCILFISNITYKIQAIYIPNNYSYNLSVENLDEPIDNISELPLIEKEESDKREKIESYIRNEIQNMQFDILDIARVVTCEAYICSQVERSAVAWCILNRVDAGYGSIHRVTTAPHQFEYQEITPSKEMLSFVEDIVFRWKLEKYGYEDVGRTLPQDYLYFWGDGRHNYFRKKITDQVYWDWSLPNPYENKGE